MSILTWAAELGANAVAPGSGILIRLGRALKPLVPWILLAAGIASLVLWIDHRGYARGKASQEPVLARALGRVKKAQVAIAHEQAELAKANAEIVDNNKRVTARAARLAADRAQVKKDEAALAKRAASTDALIAQLRASASGPRAPCTLSPAARKALEGL